MNITLRDSRFKGITGVNTDFTQSYYEPYFIEHNDVKSLNEWIERHQRYLYRLNVEEKSIICD